MSLSCPEIGYTKIKAVKAYLEGVRSSRELSKKYGVHRTIVNKGMLAHQGMYNLPRYHNQVSDDLQQKTLDENLTSL